MDDGRAVGARPAAPAGDVAVSAAARPDGAHRRGARRDRPELLHRLLPVPAVVLRHVRPVRLLVSVLRPRQPVHVGLGPVGCLLESVAAASGGWLPRHVADASVRPAVATTATTPVDAPGAEWWQHAAVPAAHPGHLARASVGRRAGEPPYTIARRPYSAGWRCREDARR